ncbi:Uncharacterised protein [Flavonifractor plautii]|nr:Uncharacterised protein [Flavonifractor plautii]
MSYFSLFQSTHPARGATRSGFLTPTVDQFQSTHPARGATFRCLDKKPLFGFQSTHPARGATRRYVCTNEGWRFQSTHPARGATSGHVAHLRLDAIISIHAPREGCDICSQRARAPSWNFNPRTPRGVRRLKSYLSLALDGEFQSTHPARGATANFTKEQRVCLAQFAYLHKGKKAEHTKTNAPMLHEAFLYAFWVRTGRRRRVLLDFARYKIKGSSGR